jgi:chromate transporter
VQGLGMTLGVPVLGSVNVPSLVLTIGALLAVFRFKIGMLPVLAACSILGLLYGVATGSI